MNTDVGERMMMRIIKMIIRIIIMMQQHVGDPEIRDEQVLDSLV